MLIFCYCTGLLFFDHHIEQNICFCSFRSSYWEIFYKIATKSLLNELKCAFESVMILLKLQAIGQ